MVGKVHINPFCLAQGSWIRNSKSEGIFCVTYMVSLWTIPTHLLHYIMEFNITIISQTRLYIHVYINSFHKLMYMCVNELYMFLYVVLYIVYSLNIGTQKSRVCFKLLSECIVHYKWIINVTKHIGNRWQQASLMIILCQQCNISFLLCFIGTQMCGNRSYRRGHRSYRRGHRKWPARPSKMTGAAI